MKLVGSGDQHVHHPMFDASGTITSGGTPQLVLPRAFSRSSLLFVNNSAVNMYLEVGGARATATLTSGSVSSIAITNAGFNFTKAPRVTFLGGGNTGNNQNNPAFLSAGLPDFPAPVNPARGTCVMTGSAGNLSIASITIDNPGSGYAVAPYVWIHPDPNDNAGCAVPSATSGFLVVANGGSWTPNGTVCTTDPIAVFCATTSSGYTCKYTT